MKPLEALALAGRLVRHPAAHKGDAGKVVLIGGAPTMSGALVLAGQAALFSGAGWIVMLMLDSQSAHGMVLQPELIGALGYCNLMFCRVLQQHTVTSIPSRSP